MKDLNGPSNVRGSMISQSVSNLSSQIQEQPAYQKPYSSLYKSGASEIPSTNDDSASQRPSAVSSNGRSRLSNSKL
jgi:hypothetical protein